MGFFQDNLIPIFKKRELAFKESFQESEHVYSFVFEKPEDVTWKAGQYGLFGITHKKIKNATKPFSLATAPAENVVQITTVIHDEPSDFKQALLELKQGMKVSMTGPLGPFYLHDDSPALLLADGIGISPFRSIIKQLEAEGLAGKQVRLVYVDSGKAHLFQDEFDRIAGNMGMTITYLHAQDEVYREMDQFAALYKDKGTYLVAGPKSAVDPIFTHLQNQKIPKKRIKKDVFFGY